MPKLEIVEDEIARKLKQAEQSGELKTAASYGKPLAVDDGWSETPEEFRMAFKALKDSGFVPPEIEVFHERPRLRARVQSCTNDNERKLLASELSSLEQKIALRLEGMRVHGRV